MLTQWQILTSNYSLSISYMIQHMCFAWRCRCRMFGQNPLCLFLVKKTNLALFEANKKRKHNLKFCILISKVQDPYTLLLLHRSVYLLTAYFIVLLLLGAYLLDQTKKYYVRLETYFNRQRIVNLER